MRPAATCLPPAVRRCWISCLSMLLPADPMVPGHEIAGIVCALGSDVKGWELGQKVGVGCFVDACRECHACEIKDDKCALPLCQELGCRRSWCELEQ